MWIQILVLPSFTGAWNWRLGFTAQYNYTVSVNHLTINHYTVFHLNHLTKCFLVTNQRNTRHDLILQSSIAQVFLMKVRFSRIKLKSYLGGKGGRERDTQNKWQWTSSWPCLLIKRRNVNLHTFVPHPPCGAIEWIVSKFQSDTKKMRFTVCILGLQCVKDLNPWSFKDLFGNLNLHAMNSSPDFTGKNCTPSLCMKLSIWVGLWRFGR